MDDSRKWTAAHPGGPLVDDDGDAWHACDPYPTWFRAGQSKIISPTAEQRKALTRKVRQIELSEIIALNDAGALVWEHDVKPIPDASHMRLADIVLYAVDDNPKVAKQVVEMLGVVLFELEPVKNSDMFV